MMKFLIAAIGFGGILASCTELANAKNKQVLVTCPNACAQSCIAPAAVCPAPTPKPTPVPTPSSIPSPSPSPTPSLVPTPTPTLLPTPSPLPSPTSVLDDSTFTYKGNWVEDADANDLNGKYHYSCEVGDIASVSFTGSQAFLYFPISTHLGNLGISVADSTGKVLSNATVSQLSSTLQDQKLIYQTAIMPQGTYTLTFTNLSVCIALDRIDVVSQPPATWTMNFGVNMDGGQYWDPLIYTDALKQASGFFFWDKTSSGKTGTVTSDINGYPQSDAQALLLMTDATPGTYTLTWKGTVTPSIPWAPSFTITGPNSANVGILPSTKSGDHQIYIQLTGFNAASPLTEMHLWGPGYSDTTTTVFLPLVTQNLKNIYIDSVRMMPYTETWGSTEVNWSDRTTGTSVSWASAAPYEATIAFAKEANLKRLWVNTPIEATNDYMTQMANLFHSTLPAGVQVMVELGNELWNFGHNDWNWVNAEGNSLTGAANITVPLHNSTHGVAFYDGNIVNGVLIPDQNGVFVTDTYTRASRAAATRAYEMAQIWKQVYADRPSDLGVVFGGQAGWNAWLMNGLAWVQAKYGNMPFKYGAIAPYFDPLWNSSQYCPTAGCKTEADLLSASTQMIAGVVGGQVDANLSVTKQYGVTLVDYEGGQNFYPLNGDPCLMTDPSSMAQRDPAFTAINEAYFSVLQAHGVDTHFEFDYMGDWSQNDGCKYGYWAMLLNPTDTVSNPRWNALAAANARHAPSLLTKMVDSVMSLFQ